MISKIKWWQWLLGAWFLTRKSDPPLNPARTATRQAAQAALARKDWAGALAVFLAALRRREFEGGDTPQSVLANIEQAYGFLLDPDFHRYVVIALDPQKNAVSGGTVGGTGLVVLQTSQASEQRSLLKVSP